MPFDRITFTRTLAGAAAELGLASEPSLLDRAADHFALVLEVNQQFNLTRIVDATEAAAKLYGDSLAALAWVDGEGAQVRRCLDIGTGAGFPAVPIAIWRPAWQVTAVDSTGKKARFIRECAASLGIDNLTAKHARAGQQKPARPFDLVLMKAVGTLERALSCTRGTVRRDGYVIVYKGPGLTRAELDAGQEQAEGLGMQTWDTFDYDLSCGAERLEHSLVIYRRVS